MANVGGPIADIWDARERGTPMAVFSLTLLRVAIPCLLDPSHNRHSQHGALSRTAHWRLNRRRNRKLALDLLGTLYLPGSHFLITLLAPETYAPIFLKREALDCARNTTRTPTKSPLDMHRVPLSTTLKIAVSFQEPRLRV